MASLPANAVKATTKPSGEEVIKSLISNEIVFAVVGAVGSGTSEIANSLRALLEVRGYKVEILKARDVIEEWAVKTSFSVVGSGKMEQTRKLQDAGDEQRRTSGDNAAIAVKLIERIKQSRARMQGVSDVIGRPVQPDSERRAFILDSLRHPDEVNLLRRVYQTAFFLIGVVCEEDMRLNRLSEKYSDAGRDSITSFMKRDEKADVKHGQQVADTFHLSDFFVDNSVDRSISSPSGERSPNPDWSVSDELGRFVDIITHQRIVRPRASETAMYHAFGAKMQSSCLSRQVGAALFDGKGNLIATGVNEVPRGGGGTYSDFDAPNDHRCFKDGRFCRNTREQNSIVEEMFTEVDELKGIFSPEVLSAIRKTRVGQIIEFSRAVHAEMDALLSAARQGKSTSGTRMYVSTFPCHNCARHIVVSGVDEVQFIEPYLKSRALNLHSDAITTSRIGWKAPSESGASPSKVLFAPFVGIAPRMYRRSFYKTRDLKDGTTGDMLTVFPEADATGALQMLQTSYADAEVKVTSDVPSVAND